MFRGYVLLLFYVTRIHSFVLEDVRCNYVHTNNCFVKVAEETPGNHSAAIMRHCEEEDIPTSVDFLVALKDNDNADFPGLLRIDFVVPKRTCKFSVTLLASTAVKNEEECEAHNFDDNDIDTQTHTPENTVCFIQNGSSALLTEANITEVLCQERMSLWFQYVFTACYALRFNFGESQHAVRANKFLRTNYERSEVQVPVVHCVYEVSPEIHHTLETIQITTDMSMTMDTRPLLRIGFYADSNEKKACDCLTYTLLYMATVNLEQTGNQNCTVSTARESNGKSARNLECNFLLNAGKESLNYCVLIHLLDERCKRNTLWNPPGKEKVPCAWIKPCARMQRSKYRYEGTANTGLSLLILVVVSTMFTMFGVLYTVHWLRTRNIIVLRYPWETSVDSTDGKSEKIPSLDEKENDYEDGERNNVVLLYPRGTTSFMTLMADFRGILSRVCRCSVHDWHEGVVWNHVARMGASDWFLETLRNDCNVIWIDTPTTRSLLSSQFRPSNQTANCEWKRSMEIGDFRDVVFPVVLNIAKKSVQESEYGRSRHFIVKFKGFEDFVDDGDPFANLSPVGFYTMPEDLSQLCSHLSTLGTFGRDTRTEEDFIRRHLTRVKDECRK